MSYCVNCGVELERNAGECPLCNTPVVNPREQMRQGSAKAGADREEAAAYLASRPEVELVSRYRNVSAVIEEDFCNADTDMRLAAGTTGTVSFYGSLLLKTPDYYYFVVDTPPPATRRSSARAVC